MLIPLEKVRDADEGYCARRFIARLFISRENFKIPYASNNKQNGLSNLGQIEGYTVIEIFSKKYIMTLGKCLQKNMKHKKSKHKTANEL